MRVNLGITNRCNKNCYFCFAKDSVLGIKDLDFETCKEVIDSCINNHYTFSLLGGEPTEYPDFSKLFNYAYTNVSAGGTNGAYDGNEFLLITNLLYNENISKEICDNIYRANYKLLANTGSIGEIEDITNIFKKNYEVLKEAYNYAVTLGYKNKFEELIFFNYIVDPEKSVEEIVERCNYLREQFPEIQNYSLGLRLPNPNFEYIYNPISNLELGNKVVAAIGALKQDKSERKISLECMIYPCMFSPSNKRYIENNCKLSNTNPFGICNSNSIDILPNKNCIYCFSTSFDYVNYTTIEESLIEINKKRVDWQVIDRCSSCEYYKNNQCGGLCKAFKKIVDSGEV